MGGGGHPGVGGVGGGGHPGVGGGGAGSDGSGGWTKHFHPCLLALGSWSLYVLCLSGECGGCSGIDSKQNVCCCFCSDIL